MSEPSASIFPALIPWESGVFDGIETRRIIPSQVLNTDWSRATYFEEPTEESQLTLNDIGREAHQALWAGMDYWCEDVKEYSRGKCSNGIHGGTLSENPLANAIKFPATIAPQTGMPWIEADFYKAQNSYLFNCFDYCVKTEQASKGPSKDDKSKRCDKALDEAVNSIAEACKT